MGVQEFGGPAWTLYGMTFGEWLPACLRGRDVTPHAGDRAPDGPWHRFLP